MVTLITGAGDRECSFCQIADLGFAQLQEAGCIFVDEEGKVEAQTLGRIASFYYLKYQTLTVFTTYLKPAMSVPEVCASLLNPAAKFRST